MPGTCTTGEGCLPFLLQLDAEIEALVEQHGKRAGTVDGEGSQHREKDVFKVLVGKFLLSRVHLLFPQEGDPLLPQERQEGTGKAGRLLLGEGVDLLGKQAELLFQG